jgi:hypothetical protein
LVLLLPTCAQYGRKNIEGVLTVVVLFRRMLESKKALRFRPIVLWDGALDLSHLSDRIVHVYQQAKQRMSMFSQQKIEY